MLSLVFFFLATFGFGTFTSFIAKESEDFLERILMRFGIGLAMLIFFGYLLNFVGVPLDWRIFLSAAILILIIRLYIDYRKKELFHVKFNLNMYALLMLILFAITFFMYAKGAFAYPYLEDDDPWSHAVGVKFVSMEKTVFVGKEGGFHYIDPYPPAYDMIMGIIHQTNDSVYWTLKFFNALIISLSIIFFFYFAKSFTKSPRKAFFSTFALFAVPAFLSHFIWAIALTMPLFFVSFYCAEKIKDDKKWWIMAALVIMPTVTSSPTHSTYFGLFFLVYFIARTIVEKKLLVYEFLAGFAGVILSFALWWIPIIMTHTFRRVVEIMGPKATTGILGVGGTGDRSYNIADFLCHSGTGCYNGQNMINNPIGIGVVLSILTIFGLFYLLSKYKEMFTGGNYYMLVLLLWFLFAFYAVNAAKMPIKLSPFRAWMLLAIPVALISGESINFINNVIKSLSKSFSKSGNLAAIISLLVLIVIGFLIYKTSFIPKYKVNTSEGWAIGGFWANPSEEIPGYIWFKDNIPAGTKVFTFSNNGLIIGLDKFICHWCSDVREFQRTGIKKTPEEIYSWLKENGYKYMVIDAQTAKKIGVNETSMMLEGLAKKYSVQQVTQGFFILRVS